VIDFVEDRQEDAPITERINACRMPLYTGRGCPTSIDNLYSPKIHNR